MIKNWVEIWMPWAFRRCFMKRKRREKIKKCLGIGYCTLVYLFLFLPISAIVVNSFNATTTKPYLSWKGFTFDWYVKL